MKEGVSSKMGLGWNVVGKVRATEKIERSGRAHSGNFEKKDIMEVPDVLTIILVSVRTDL